jgi:hypothetical protein
VDLTTSAKHSLVKGRTGTHALAPNDTLHSRYACCVYNKKGIKGQCFYTIKSLFNPTVTVANTNTTTGSPTMSPLAKGTTRLEKKMVRKDNNQKKTVCVSMVFATAALVFSVWAMATNQGMHFLS